VAYLEPLSDSVPRASQVDVPEDLSFLAVNIETVEDAVEVYLEASELKFSGTHGSTRKKHRLDRFVTYLEATGHSMKLADLAFVDGQRFIDLLDTPRDNKSQLGLQHRKRIRGVLRSFSRFLATARLIEEDVFFSLRIG
jgi:hypothetical protein